MASSSLGTLITLGCVIGFPLFWCLISWLIARIGGWHALAVRFPSGPSKPPGVRMFYMESLEMGASQYKGCVFVGVAPSGLFLATLPLFVVGHKPILIPWEAITRIKVEKQFWLTVHELTVPLGTFNTATITLPSKTLALAIVPHLSPQALQNSPFLASR